MTSLIILTGSFIVLSIILQGFTTYFGFRLYQLAKPTKLWTCGWGLFTSAMAIITLRRIVGLLWFLQDEKLMSNPQFDHIFIHLTESVALLAVSLLLTYFINNMKELFLSYMNGKAHKILDDKNKT